MRVTKKLLGGCIIGAMAVSLNVSAAESASIADAFANGKASTLLRYRVELVDQDSLVEDATASTLLARLNFKTDEYKNFSLFTEFDTVVAVGDEQYNSGAGTSGADRAIYPVVADPEGTEVNQAYIAYSGFNDALVKVGRQRIVLDNQRYVGGVAWRQNEQTYDGISIDKKFSGVDLKYAYVGNVNRIFGESVAGGDHNSRTHLLNLSRKFTPGKLTAYYYSIDNKDALAFSTNTIGLRWAGSKLFGNPAIGYGLEYASQSENGDNPVDYSTDYFRLDASYKFKPAKLYFGYEVLGGDENVAGSSFRTPLATLHAFNGWADQFLGTPGNGLEDIFVGATGKLNRWKWNVKYHDFSASEGSGEFGSEIDFSIATKISKNYGVLLKYANFSSDVATRSDISKVWLMFTAKY